MPSAGNQAFTRRCASINRPLRWPTPGLSPSRKLLVKHQLAKSVNPAARRFGNSASPRQQIDCFSPAGRISPEKRPSVYESAMPSAPKRVRVPVQWNALQIFPPLIHRYANPAPSAHGASVSIGAMPPASFQHCSGICIRIARGCRFITHNQIHNQSYVNLYLPCKSLDRVC
jgi:hypothetical protein